MTSFRIDFAMNRGHEMLLDREAGIGRAELDDIELHMLQSQRIPFVLPMDWLELDGRVTFRYRLDGYKMIRHRLQMQPLTMNQFYAILLGVADALDECRNYMLRPENFLLDEQFVFSGDRLHDIRLAYVPMKGKDWTAAPAAEGMLMLIIKLTAHVDQLDGNGLQRVLQHADAAKWSLSELKSLLLELIGDEGSARPKERLQLPKEEVNAQPHPAPPESSSQSQPKARVSSWSTTGAGDAGAGKLPNAQPFYALPSDAGRSGGGDWAGMNDGDAYAEIEDEEEADSRNGSRRSRSKWLFGAAYTIIVATVWRFIYFNAKNGQSLLMCAGITLLLGAFLLAIGFKREKEQEVWRELDDTDEGDFDASVADAESVLRSRQAAFQAERLDSYASPAAQRVVEPTALLGSERVERGAAEPRVWLERSWEGEQTRIELQDRNFVIGRTGEQLDYEDETSKVSRIHLEIAYSKGERLAKDVGSRNGSLLNGQAMIAYKAYKLAIGDIIHLAGADGPAYELKSG